MNGTPTDTDPNRATPGDGTASGAGYRDGSPTDTAGRDGVASGIPTGPARAAAASGTVRSDETRTEATRAAAHTAPNVRRDGQRYVVSVDGVDAGFAAFSDEAGVRDFNHTVVRPEFRGQGLSRPLLTAALDATRAEGLAIRPTCSAVRGFVDKRIRSTRTWSPPKPTSEGRVRPATGLRRLDPGVGEWAFTVIPIDVCQCSALGG